MHSLLVFILCAKRNWAKQLLAVAHNYCPGNKAAAASIILFNLQLDDLLALYLDLISLHELVSRFLFQKLSQVQQILTNSNFKFHVKSRQVRHITQKGKWDVRKQQNASMQQMCASYKCEIVSNLSQTSNSKGFARCYLRENWFCWERLNVLWQASVRWQPIYDSGVNQF